tara:strand:+ start:164 stop:1039 length:876 start_codon:yes stop_codon:yes gene_type:complete
MLNKRIAFRGIEPFDQRRAANFKRRMLDLPEIDTHEINTNDPPKNLLEFDDSNPGLDLAKKRKAAYKQVHKTLIELKVTKQGDTQFVDNATDSDDSGDSEESMLSFLEVFNFGESYLDTDRFKSKVAPPNPNKTNNPSTRKSPRGHVPRLSFQQGQEQRLRWKELQHPNSDSKPQKKSTSKKRATKQPLSQPPKPNKKKDAPPCNNTDTNYFQINLDESDPFQIYIDDIDGFTIKASDGIIISNKERPQDFNGNDGQYDDSSDRKIPDLDKCEYSTSKTLEQWKNLLFPDN